MDPGTSCCCLVGPGPISLMHSARSNNRHPKATQFLSQILYTNYVHVDSQCSFFLFVNRYWFTSLDVPFILMNLFIVSVSSYSKVIHSNNSLFFPFIWPFLLCFHRNFVGWPRWFGFRPNVCHTTLARWEDMGLVRWVHIPTYLA
jgi:hypothetical protein